MRAEQGIGKEDDIESHIQVRVWGRRQKWESQSPSLATLDPAAIPHYDLKTEVGRALLLDDIPMGEGGKGCVGGRVIVCVASVIE